MGFGSENFAAQKTYLVVLISDVRSLRHYFFQLLPFPSWIS